jgi:hypothetical protein
MEQVLIIIKKIKYRENILFSLILGIAIGVITVLGQGVLPGNWNSIANSGAVWLLPTFFIGSLNSKKLKASLSGILALLGMVIGYYGYAMIVQQVAHSFYFILVWSVCGIIGGIIFGIAGFLWSRRGPLHTLGSALIGGVFITEGLNILIHRNDYRHMITVGYVEIIFGILLVLILGRSIKERLLALSWLLLIVILGIIGYQVLRFFT